jgi:hypothetical protein
VKRISWYSRRLRSMNAGEVAWRVQRAAQDLTSRRVVASIDDTAPEWLDDTEAAFHRFRKGSGRPLLLTKEGISRVAAQCPAGTAELMVAADRVMDLRFQYFGYPEVRLPQPVDWQYDPLAKFRWPSLPARKIDHRTSGVDSKWIWELNRLQHLPWLAQAWLLTGDSRYSAAAFDQVDTWIEQNPPGRGIAWRGAFEVGVRAISIALAVQGLRDSPHLTPARYQRLVALMDESARRCWRERSRFSSANNHLVGELCGLAVISLLFPELAGAAKWERSALEELAVQADRQILPDGVGAEQAPGYQMFVSELMMLVAQLVRMRDGAAPPRLLAAIERSATYLAAVVGDRDPEPRIGDDDEGFAVRLGAEPVRTIRDHLGIVGAFAGHLEARRCGRSTPAAVWFASPREPVLPGRAVASASPSLFAPDGGVVVLRSRSRRVMMDVGPLGYLSLAAHGHADALSVMVALDGKEIVGDPGAASYYGHPDWRAVHRGTRAHATVSVDEMDQSQMGGPFLWTGHARTTVHHVDLTRGIVDAQHDGYRRLAQPVGHRRWLVAPGDWDELLVVDRLDGVGYHSARTSWPLPPDLNVRRGGLGHVLERDGVDLVGVGYAASVPFQVEQIRGDEEQGLGWWSYRLESRVPSWWIGIVCADEVPMVMATLFRPISEPGCPLPAPTLSIEDDKIVVEWPTAAGRRVVGITVQGLGTVSMETSSM